MQEAPIATAAGGGGGGSESKVDPQWLQVLQTRKKVSWGKRERNTYYHFSLGAIRPEETTSSTKTGIQ